MILSFLYVKKSLILGCQITVAHVNIKSISVISIFFFIIIGGSSAQSPFVFDELQKPDSISGGSLTIHQSDKVEKVTYRHLNEVNNQGVYGYRIIIFRQSGPKAKKLYNDVGERFRSKIDLPLYYGFEHNNYIWYAGDFRTKSEALKYMKLIERVFSNDKHIIPIIQPNTLINIAF